MTDRKKRFTLIELLITVAIIAILAGLLLPALNAARRKAQAINCVNSQKQIMTAQYSYAGDYNDIMVVNAPYKMGARDVSEPWMTLLTREKSNTGTLPKGGGYISWNSLKCPANSNLKKNDQMWFSVYGFWRYNGINDRIRQTGNIFGSAVDGNPPDINSVFLYPGRAKSPSQTFVLADTATLKNGFAGKSVWIFSPREWMEDGNITSIHSGRLNAGFIDGHVQALTPFQARMTNTKSKFWIVWDSLSRGSNLY